MGAFIAMGMLSTTEAIKVGRAAFFLSITVYLCAFGLWVCAYVTTQERGAHDPHLPDRGGGDLRDRRQPTLFMDGPGLQHRSPNGQRAEALFDDPNIYGPFLVAVSLLLLQELIEPRLLRRWGRPLLAPLTAIVTIGWFLSYSRAAWLNYAVALAVFLALLPLRRGATRALVLVLVVIAGAGTTVATVVLTGQSTFVQERAQKQSYDTDRFGAQRLGIEVAGDAAARHRAGSVRGRVARIRALDLHPRRRRAGLHRLPARDRAVRRHPAGGDQQRLMGQETAGRSPGLLAIWCGTLANSVFDPHIALAPPVRVRGLIWSGSLAAPAISQASSRAGVRNPM